MKIKLHSQYDHFPNCQTDGDDFDLELWNDGKIWEYVQKLNRYVNSSEVITVTPERAAILIKAGVARREAD